MALFSALRVRSGSKAKNTPHGPRSRVLQVGAGGNPGDHTNNRMRSYGSFLNAVTIPGVYMAVSVIAANFAACPMQILDENDEAVDIKQTCPALYKLLKQPNPEQDRYVFDEAIMSDLVLTGNAIAALDNPALEVDDAGENVTLVPSEMWRLRPDMVRIRRASNGDLEYGYDVEIDARTETIWYASNEIIHFKMANPLNPLWGMGPIEAGEVTLSADRRLHELKFGYFDRGAILDGVLTTEGDMDDDEYERLITRWRALREGKRNRIKTAILWSGAKYQPIQEPMGNIPIVDLTKMSRNDILQLIGVPPMKVGDFTDANYSNGREADAYFWDETMVPYFRRMESGWNKLVRMFGPYHVAYEARQITDFQMRATTALALGQTGAFTRNDLRVAAGYDPLPEGDPLGDVFIGSTRQQLFPGEYNEPKDLLPMTLETLLTPEEYAAHLTKQSSPSVSQPGGGSGGASPGADRIHEKSDRTTNVNLTKNAGFKSHTILDDPTDAAQRAARRGLWPRQLETTFEQRRRRNK